MEHVDAAPPSHHSALTRMSGWLAARSLDERRQIARVKQVVEWMCADPQLRQLAETSPDALEMAFAERGLQIDPLAVRPFWDKRIDSAEIREYPAVLAYQDWKVEMTAHRAAIRELAGSGAPAFDAWRARMMTRARGSLNPSIESEIVHAAAAFELASGCSIGCNFCAFGASKLVATALYDQATAELWNGMLGALAHYVGPAAGSAFAYWATDPYDTADYLAFLDVFADKFGHVPPTTSARATSDIGMTHRLIEQIKVHGGGPLRASILTIKQLRRLHAAIPLEDQPYVTTAIQTAGAAIYRIAAGRAFTGERATRMDKPGGEGTIACVTGFLVNLPEKRVRLVSPCVADRRWPNGYRVHDERSFDDAATFAACIADMIERAMSMTLAGDAMLLLRPGLSAQPGAPLLLQEQYFQYRLTDTPLMRSLLPRLAEGGACADIEQALVREGHSPFAVKSALQELFVNGLLADQLDIAQINTVIEGTLS